MIQRAGTDGEGDGEVEHGFFHFYHKEAWDADERGKRGENA